ncbi:hypothetical protein [Escherichia coli]|uniref:hypothetical protein n=1 Tax=Escherichia coli TaxID=562 RepID=UPI002027112C|nr:hypothetical protein [Escherichia coli]
MFIDSEKRLKQLSDEAKKNTEDLEEAKKNSRFTQVSPKGWERVRELLKDSQGISRKIQGLHRYPQKVGNVFESC